MQKMNQKDCISTSKPSFVFSVRFLLSINIFLAIAIQYMQKIDMSIGIVCMVNQTAVNEHKDHSEILTYDNNQKCMFQDSQNSTNPEGGSFDWSKSVQGMILSSYFYGYIITQIPGGWLSMRYGEKKVLGISMLIGSIFTALSAPSAKINYLALILCRFMTGLAHGAVWPSLVGIFKHWTPPLEKSRLIGFAVSGKDIGNMLGFPLGGWLCINGFDDGWGSIFYIFGLAGVVWFVLFMFSTSDHPNSHKFISDHERVYINDSLGNSNDSSKNNGGSLPWKKIFTSKPCIAIFVSHVCINWCNYLFLTQLPSYMKEILKFDIKSNGLFSAIPYISCWLIASVTSVISDYLISRKFLSRNKTRKLFNSLALLVPMIASICIAFVTCTNPYLAVGLLSIAVGFFGCASSGFQVNVNEIAGIYSGVLFGVSNTFATLSGIVVPFLVGLLTSNGKQEEWRLVFMISAGVYLFGAIFYLIFADTKPIEWSRRPQENIKF